MFLLEKYTVLEKPIDQTFDKCKGSGTTMYINRVDVVIFMALRLAKKMAIVRCNGTGKPIHKKHWNSQTQAKAKQLLAQHKTPKLGFIVVYSILIGIFGYFALSPSGVIKSSYEKSFMGKSEEKQAEILNALRPNDSLLSIKAIYRIKSVNEKTVVLEKNVGHTDWSKFTSFEPINESLFFRLPRAF